MKYQMVQLVFRYYYRHGGTHLFRSVGEPHLTIEAALSALNEARARCEVLLPKDRYEAEKLKAECTKDNENVLICYQEFLIKPIFDDGQERIYRAA